MITPELITYIQKQLAAGVPRDVITKSLASNGWSPEEVTQACMAVSATAVSREQKIKRPSFTGRKIFLSFAFVFATVLYAFFQYVSNSQQTPTVATSLPLTQQNQPTNSSASDSSLAPATQPDQTQSGNTTTVVNQTPPTSAPPPVQTPAPKPTGQYADGSYTGTAANAYYGTVQVKAVVQNGALADVRFLQYPNDRRTSQYINSQAMPDLISEAIQVQSANVDIVSGATFTSQAFQQSLGSALAQAKN